MGDVSIHIESLAVEGVPEPDAVVAALAEHLGDRLSPDQLAATGAAIRDAVRAQAPAGGGEPGMGRHAGR